MFIKPMLTRLKPYLRWVILGGTLFFIAKTLKDHWQEVSALQVTPHAKPMLVLAFIFTLIAHVWAGWVWHWILTTFNQFPGKPWTIQVYLTTNVAKYLPGNVWHFYGRVRALQSRGASVNIAVISVVMEPLLMAVAALIVACLGGWQLSSGRWQIASVTILTLVLVGIHPRTFNPILQKISRIKAKKLALSEDNKPLLCNYPLYPLLGEIAFVILRSLGFIFTLAALQPLTTEMIQPLVGAFSFAWVLGLVVPGAPGGVGIFEATIIALLSAQFSAAVLLGSVAFYRLLSTLAEMSGAALAWVSEKFLDMVRSQ